ncbi:MAG: hypothetical protein FJ087_04370 [Deltaproteobacteria bacterium]|nr:hypothetical protein [Deltaproteobacteria bacterium]
MKAARIWGVAALASVLMVTAAGGCAARVEAADAPRGADATKDAPKEVDVKPLAVSKWTGRKGPGWAEFDKLVDEQKLEEAAKIAEGVLADAKASGNAEEQTRALITWTQLRIGLHGYETAVRFLAEQPWPEDLLSRVVLDLYFAHALERYAQMYSWEINKREKVETKGTVDLKAWTMVQIHEAAARAAADAWSHRERLAEFPVAHLAEYLEPNNYPKHIRPTLRDAASYLLATALSSTQGWTPEQSADVFRLDLGRLLADGAASQADPADGAVHPVVRVVAVLGDLEAWHAGRGEVEAALEARLERLGHLHTHFTGAPDRERIRKDLSARLPAARKHPWWSYGMARLAQMVRETDAPDALVAARKLALEGRDAYPDSPGGHACRSVVEGIEHPHYQLEAMAADGPGRRSISVTYRNLKQMWFRAYAMDLRSWIVKSNDWSIFPSWDEVRKSGAKVVAEWSADLPETTDFRDHRAYATPPMRKPGFYVVVASARKGFDYGDNQMAGVPMTVGDLVTATRDDDGGFEVRVLSGSAGRPLRGANVHLYRHDWRTRHREVDSEETGEDGFAVFKGVKQGESHFVLATRGEDVAIDPEWMNAWRRGRDSEQTGTLLFTDRSIYRPQQKVLWKAVVYRGREDKWRSWIDAGVTVTLHDANGEEVARSQVTTNAFGTASGEFQIPAGRLLGHWSIRSSANGHAGIRVEEYKRPTFEAKMLDPEAALRLNREAVVKGEARYYFGLPVTDSSIRWRVTREPVYPWWWGWWWGAQPTARTQTIATGTAKGGEDGRFSIAFTPEADERLAGEGSGITYRYKVVADVTDEGGETRTAERSFRLGFTGVEATLDVGAGFVGEGRRHDVAITRTDLDGTASPGKGRWRLVRVNDTKQTLLPADQPLPEPPGGAKGLKTAGDRLRPRFDPQYRPEAVMRSWPDGAERASGDLAHDAKGVAKAALPALEPGPWRLRYETVDAFGAKYETAVEFVVAGRRAEVSLPALLRVEQSSVKVGGTARVLVTSGLADQPLELSIWREGRLVERRAIEAGRDAAVVEIPVGEKDRGGFGVSLLAVRDHQWMRFTESVFVPWDDRELEVSFTTFRDKMQPGGKEKWTVKVTGPAGRDTAVAAAELLAYMYDRSLDFFAPHHPPSATGLYPYRASVGHVRTNLERARTIWVGSAGFGGIPSWPDLRADALRFHESYGVGGPGARGGYYRGAGGMRSRAMMPPPAPSVAAPMAKMVASEMRRESADALAEQATAAPAEAMEGEKNRAGDDSRDGKEGQAAPEVQLRANFAETAFWSPHLVTEKDGSAAVEFTVPDSVTAWNVWVHAVTNEMKGGSVHKESRSVKDLMVRPYLPRFLREGDRAELKVVVNNASDKPMSGMLTFDVLEPGTEKSLLADFGLKAADVRDRPFDAPPGGGTTLTFAVTAPARVGTVAFKVSAVAGQLGDGELRPIPVLPGRMHLAQSRFVTLKGKQVRQMKFADLARNDDPSLINEQMVVTIDGQLFYSVLSAVPYLVRYPYECTEQTLNRFISTGILTSMFEKYPSVKRMAAEFAGRTTMLETFDAPDPNRKMALEETPWLVSANGGGVESDDLVNVLDPRIATANRNAALAKLKKSQTSSGGFPWFPGGPPSPYMTLYLLYGFSKAIEFKVEVPEDMIRRAWAYVHRHYIDELVRTMMALDCCWEFITFLNYTISNYPDPSWTGFSDAERKRMLDFSFRHWKRHAPYVKGQLALTLLRMGRAGDAKRVWESVMDSAKEAEDQGVFWAPEDRAWLWYNDTIETHAFAIRVLMDLIPDSPKLDGLVLWIFLNKKLNHWKSTKATAEVVYSLAKYLDAVGQTSVREEATVDAGGDRTTFVFEPDKYTGRKNQIVVPGEKVDPARHSTITVEKTTPGYMFASATWHFSTERMPDEDRGDYLSVSRTYFRRETQGTEARLQPLADGARVAVGDQIEVHVSLRAKHAMEYVHLRDPRGAGFEPEGAVSRHRWEQGIYWYEEIRDSGTNFFFESLPQGEYTFKYRVRAATAGTFKAAPATVQPMYAPEFNAYSAGTVLTVVPAP